MKAERAFILPSWDRREDREAGGVVLKDAKPPYRYGAKRFNIEASLRSAFLQYHPAALRASPLLSQEGKSR